MKGKVSWLTVSSLMVLSLVMAACAPAVVEKPKPEIVEKPKPEVVEQPEVEKPKYGGVLKIGTTSDIYQFDDILGQPNAAITQHLTNERLWMGDWAKGTAGGYGSKEADWTGDVELWKLQTGRIAESWELPTKIEGDKATLLFYIRKGMNWALNPASEASRLVGGRELTADDVVSTLNTYMTDKRAYLYRSNPELRIAQISSPAPSTVKIEVPWEVYQSAVFRFTSFAHIVPPEVVKKYDTMRDWKVSVGSGPFILADFVPGSSATLVKNSNYWMKDPVGPGKGNQLPYLDGVKYLIIPDTSTLYAALRTGRIDTFRGGISQTDAFSLQKVAPHLMSARQALTQGSAIAMKLDSPPFNDIRVRRALMMAIDFERIKRDLYGGGAQIVTYPIVYDTTYADAYYGPEPDGVWPADAPESIKELYTYNPEKAKKLLAEAGYPNGFKTNLILGSATEEIDYYSIYKDMWSKVGVDLELRPKESGTYETIRAAKSFDQMSTGLSGKLARMYQLSLLYPKTGASNIQEIDDPVVNEAHPKIQTAMVFSADEANAIHRELMKYVLEQAWAIPRVMNYEYGLWQPWLKNYSGERNVGYKYETWPTWVWLDQELKKTMGF